MIDVANRNVRQVKTPAGIGTFWGVDDKDKPKKVSVTLKVDGYKVPQVKSFAVEECEEVEK